MAENPATGGTDDAARLISIIDEIGQLLFHRNRHEITAKEDIALRALDIQFGIFLKRIALENVFNPLVKSHGEHWEILPNCKLAVYKNQDVMMANGEIFENGSTVDDSSQWRATLKALRSVVSGLKKDESPQSGAAPESDILRDKPKKPRKRGKHGPQKPLEFLQFRKEVEKGIKKNKTLDEIALDFTDGDERKKKALLRKWHRHKNSSSDKEQ